MPEPDRPIVLGPRRDSAGLGVGLIGAGAFARTILVPAFREAGFDRFISVASASGLSARRIAERAGFEKAVSGADAVIDDPDVQVVVIATPHDSHARLAARALRAGKHVYCEKPVALTQESLHEVASARHARAGVFFVGYNRRFSAAVEAIVSLLRDADGPLTITYRVNAGTVPFGHWYHDRRQGGRLLGEACHFVDTCVAIAGSEATGIQAYGVGSRSEQLLTSDFALLIRFRDNALATITYSSGGHPSMPKERIDVMGRGHGATMDDFRSLNIDGRRVALSADRKGHTATVTRFYRAIVGDRAPDISNDFLDSMSLTIKAAAGLTGSSIACQSRKYTHVGATATTELFTSSDVTLRSGKALDDD